MGSGKTEDGVFGRGLSRGQGGLRTGGMGLGRGTDVGLAEESLAAVADAARAGCLAAAICGT